jgi:hypothetical protein
MPFQWMGESSGRPQNTVPGVIGGIPEGKAVVSGQKYGSLSSSIETMRMMTSVIHGDLRECY